MRRILIYIKRTLPRKRCNLFIVSEVEIASIWSDGMYARYVFARNNARRYFYKRRQLVGSYTYGGKENNTYTLLTPLFQRHMRYLLRVNS